MTDEFDLEPNLKGELIELPLKTGTNIRQRHIPFLQNPGGQAQMKALPQYFFVIATSVIVTASQLRAAECEALRSVFEKWVAAYANRDLAGTISIFADDVNFSFQGAPDAKKADLEKSYRDEFAHPEQSRRWIPKFEEFQCSGKLGFVRSTWRLEVTSADGKIEIKAENRSVDILRLSGDGTWKIFRSLNYPVVAPKK